MSLCLKCGKQLDKKPKFCPGCGTPNPIFDPDSRKVATLHTYSDEQRRVMVAVMGQLMRDAKDGVLDNCVLDQEEIKRRYIKDSFSTFSEEQKELAYKALCSAAEDLVNGKGRAMLQDIDFHSNR